MDSKPDLSQVEINQQSSNPDLGLPMVKKSEMNNHFSHMHYDKASYFSVSFEKNTHYMKLKLCFAHADLDNINELNNQRFNLYLDDNKLILAKTFTDDPDGYLLEHNVYSKSQILIPTDHLPYSLEYTRGDLNFKTFEKNKVQCIEVMLPDYVFIKVKDQDNANKHYSNQNDIDLDDVDLESISEQERIDQRVWYQGSPNSPTEPTKTTTPELIQENQPQQPDHQNIEEQVENFNDNEQDFDQDFNIKNNGQNKTTKQNKRGFIKNLFA